MTDLPDVPDLPDWWPWPWPGGEDPSQQEPTTYYIRWAEGQISKITASPGTAPAIPDGATVLTEEQYNDAMAEVQQAQETKLAELEAAEAAIRLQQYTDLRAAGIPEATARSLSGYTDDEGQAEGA